jgi:saccharopine dehydrogenase (NAD+, L-lysine forming)
LNVLVIGAGGVGSAVAAIALRRSFFDRMTIADRDEARAQRVAAAADDGRFAGVFLDASSAEAIVACARAAEADVILNATDPRFNPQIFAASFETRSTYLDMALTLSEPDAAAPFERPGVKLGDRQFAEHERWRDAGLLALVGIGVEPGLSDVFARYARDHLFTSISEIGVRDGANLVVEGYAFAPTFSIWTTIEECLNPPLVWERTRGFYTTEPFSDPEVFEFPEGIGPIECVNVEHEEVVLIPREIECERVTFKYGLGDDFIEVLKTLNLLGLDSKEPVAVGDVAVAPRDLVAAVLPDPAQLGERMTGKTCAGTLVSGVGTDGAQRSVYLYHVADNEQTMREYGAQAVVWQTAINPVLALELLADGTWTGRGVLGPEAFDAVPFLDRMRDSGWNYGMVERSTADVV